MTTGQVWVCGEALIDLIPDGTERKAVVGGGPANTAKALAKLGIATQFIDGISSDTAASLIVYSQSGVGFLPLVNGSQLTRSTVPTANIGVLNP